MGGGFGRLMGTDTVPAMKNSGEFVMSWYKYYMFGAS